MATTYTPTIGLEIHAELKTKSKMFCGCTNNPEYEVANRFICPVCMAHPGTLPAINREAVFQVLRVGTAVGGTLATFSEFDRKNYFYPDIPKNYQISQFKYPLVQGGKIGDVSITRIHLEEDTARSAHASELSKVDFNRAGVPLMELVTEPVIHDAQTAVSFARELRLLLQYLEASDANLEKGEMRIEANISVSKESGSLGTKVEVKNLNSFKAAEQAIQYEIERHIALLEKGEKVVQETRGWDENALRTFSQRLKEESHDYRYYPDPDLPKLYIDEISHFSKEKLLVTIPTLPWEVRDEYVKQGMNTQMIDLLVADRTLNTFYSGVVQLLKDEEEVILARNYIVSDLLGTVSKQEYVGKKVSEMNISEFATLIGLISRNVVSSRGAKNVLAQWVQTGGDPMRIAETLRVVQISDDETLKNVALNVVRTHEKVVEEYRSGKETALQYLVGQAMRETKGAGNPEVLQRLLKEVIGQ